jgi:hypothetical protein
MRQLLVFGEKVFKIEVPDDAKITFGPWSPPVGRNDVGFRESGRATGTLRVYRGSKENIVALFAGVTGFRDLDLDYQEQVAVEEGAAIWKSDNEGYLREEKVSRRKEWVGPELIAPPIPPMPEDEIEDEPPPPRTRRKKAT